MKYKTIYLVISGAVLVPGIISLATFGLNLDIDFTGGSVFEYDLGRTDVEKATIRQIFAEKEIETESVSFRESGRVVIKTKPVSTEVGKELTNLMVERLGREGIASDESGAKESTVEQISFETIGPSIGAETTKKAFSALAVASVGILLYIAFAFRNIPKPCSSFRFGATAIAAMLHDAVLVLGIFSILGHYLGVQIDALFITAVLTVIGFSVHDTIVVFDRIRENLKKLPGNWDFEEIVNYSVAETLNRSIATSLTVIVVLLALYLLGGESIRWFVLALLVGIASGTYSSIFTASPILVLWEKFVRKN